MSRGEWLANDYWANDEWVLNGWRSNSNNLSIGVGIKSLECDLTKK